MTRTDATTLVVDEHGRAHRLDGPAHTEVDAATGQVVEEHWYQHGHRHRTDGPARVNYHNGTPVSMQWQAYGRAHRTDGPASLVMHPDGSLAVAAWAHMGVRHRVDGPARVKFAADGTLTKFQYKQFDVKHRLDGPAEYVAPDPILGGGLLEWAQQGLAHRVGGPATLSFCADRTVAQVIWNTLERRHRLDGPAFVKTDGTGYIGWIVVGTSTVYLQGDPPTDS